MTEPTKAQIEEEFPGWRVAEGAPDGLVHAHVPNTETWVTGEDLRDLRDQIIRTKWRASARAELHDGGPGPVR